MSAFPTKPSFHDWDEFLHQELPALHRFLRRRISGRWATHFDAEDVVQIAALQFLEYVRAHPKLARRSPRGTLYRIALRSLATLTRPRGTPLHDRQRQVMLEETVEQPLNPGQANDPFRRACDRENRELLAGAVSRLQERDRSVVQLRMEQRTFTHIGSTLNLSPNAARMRCQRAFRRLRANLPQLSTSLG